MWIEDNSFGGLNIYRVMDDNGMEYDQFVSSIRLTWAQQAEVAKSYESALNGYTGGYDV